MVHGRARLLLGLTVTAVLAVTAAPVTAAAAVPGAAVSASAPASADRITVRVGVLPGGYQASGPVTTGGIAVTDTFDGQTAGIAGSAVLASGVRVTADVRRDGLVLSGPVGVVDERAGVRIRGGGLLGFTRVSDDTVTWSGLATVTKAGSSSLQPVTVTIVDGVVDPGDHAVNLVHAGQNRQAIVHVPARPAAAKLPVLYHFPGLGEYPQIAEDTGQLVAASNRHGYVLVVPAHFGFGWQGVPAGTPFPDADDPGYIRALNTVLLQRFSGDATRVYASGMSNGGFFTNLVGCKLSDVFAAIAPVAGQLSDVAGCSPSRPMPIVSFHGDADAIVPYATVASALAFWARHNRCGTGTDDVALPDVAPADGTTVIRHTYRGCPAGAPVVLYQIVGGGHTWPGGTPYPVDTGALTKDISANDVIWQFVSQYRR